MYDRPSVYGSAYGDPAPAGPGKPRLPRWTDPGTFSDQVSTWLRGPGAGGAAKLRVYGTKTVGRKQVHDKSKLLHRMDWAPADESAEDGDDWSIEEFLLNNADRLPRSVGLDRVLAVVACSPTGDVIARTYVDFTGGTSSSEGRNDEDDDPLSHRSLGRLLRAQLAEDLSERLSGRGRRIEPERGSGEGLGLIRLDDGRLTDADGLRQMYQNDNSELRILRDKVRDLEEREDDKPNPFMPVLNKAVETGMNVLGTWLAAKVGAPGAAGATTGGAAGTDAAAQVNQGLEQLGQVAGSMQDTWGANEPPRYRTVAGPQMGQRAPRPAAPRAPQGHRPEDLYNSPLADETLPRTPGRPGSFHDVFGGGVSGAPVVTTGPRAQQVVPVPFDTRLVPVVSAVLANTRDLMGRISPWLQQAKFMQAAREESVDVFVRELPKAGIPRTEAMVRLQDPESFVKSFMGAVPARQREELGSMMLEATRHMVLDLVRTTDWKTKLAALP